MVSYRMKWPLGCRVWTVTCSVHTSIWATASYSFLRKTPICWLRTPPPRVREGLQGPPPRKCTQGLQVSGAAVRGLLQPHPEVPTSLCISQGSPWQQMLPARRAGPCGGPGPSWAAWHLAPGRMVQRMVPCEAEVGLGLPGLTFWSGHHIAF